MDLLEHKDWPTVAPWVVVDVDRRTLNGRPRYRLELMSTTPAKIRRIALRIKIRCPACRKWMRPFRKRAAPNKRNEDSTFDVYLAAACKPSDSPGCSKGNDAKFANEAVGNDVLQRRAAA